MNKIWIIQIFPQASSFLHWLVLYFLSLFSLIIIIIVKYVHIHKYTHLYLSISIYIYIYCYICTHTQTYTQSTESRKGQICLLCNMQWAPTKLSMQSISPQKKTILDRPWIHTWSFNLSSSQLFLYEVQPWTSQKSYCYNRTKHNSVFTIC